MNVSMPPKVRLHSSTVTAWGADEGKKNNEKKRISQAQNLTEDSQ